MQRFFSMRLSIARHLPRLRSSRTNILWSIAALLITIVIVAGCVVPAVQSPTNGDSAESNLQAAASTDSATVVADTEGNSANPSDGVTFLPPADPPRNLTFSPWTTDFDRRIVEWGEIRSGGPSKDGIPAIDEPEFESVDSAAEWLSSRDPVILFNIEDDVRAYPLAILMWHEIVNDRVGGQHVTVTFCPLCNASIVFDREFDDRILDFGTTGLLRNSDLVMYDRQTETWWQQFTGQGLVGQYAGERLDFLAAQVISFEDFATQYPGGQVLARPPVSRAYGSNPYTQYDSTSGRPFLFDGEIDDRLGTMERVAGLIGDESAVAYPFSVVATAEVINDEFEDRPIVIMHSPGTASALDVREISEGRDVGSIGVFDRRVDNRTLTFTAHPAGFSDEETGSVWNHLGLAIDGDLKGTQLERILAFDHFWFAWAAFFPETKLYE